MTDQVSTFPREHFRALVLFSDAFSTLIGSGVSIMRSLNILQQHAPAPYSEGAEALQPPIEAGGTLSQAMQARPDLFSPFFVALVHIGEIGGILDETLRIAADCLHAEWKLPAGGDASPLVPGAATPGEWAGLDDRRRRLSLMLFCRCLGALLSAGVPARLAVETVAEVLPSTQRSAAQALPAGDIEKSIGRALSGLGFLPPLVLSLLAVGEECGAAPRMLEKAAQVYEFELAMAG